MRFPFAVALCAPLVLPGCASTLKPPLEPDMSHTVPVNRTLPGELVGRAVLPARTPLQQTKGGDVK